MGIIKWNMLPLRGSPTRHILKYISLAIMNGSKFWTQYLRTILIDTIDTIDILMYTIDTLDILMDTIDTIDILMDTIDTSACSIISWKKCVYFICCHSSAVINLLSFICCHYFICLLLVLVNHFTFYRFWFHDCILIALHD